MPKTIKTLVYLFSELSDTAKEKAVNWWLECSWDEVDCAFEQVKDDAANIGLEIEMLDDRRSNKGKFKTCALDCARAVIKNHGAMCETYKTAAQYLPALENEDDSGETSEEFLCAILEDYRIMLGKEIEYRTSEEYIKDAMEVNEYTFTEDGKRFG